MLAWMEISRKTLPRQKARAPAHRLFPASAVNTINQISALKLSFYDRSRALYSWWHFCINPCPSIHPSVFFCARLQSSFSAFQVFPSDRVGKCFLWSKYFRLCRPHTVPVASLHLFFLNQKTQLFSLKALQKQAVGWIWRQAILCWPLIELLNFSKNCNKNSSTGL